MKISGNTSRQHDRKALPAGPKTGRKGNGMNFKEYGFLEWLDEKDFWSGQWSVYGQDIGEDGESYDIVASADGTEIRYTII